jgi:hypothetical protein
VLEQRSPNGECWELLNSITNEERAQLIHFSQCRIAHFGLTKIQAEELYQQALCSIIQGIHREEDDKSKRKGRKPRPIDVQSRANFLNYVRGAINSIAEGWARLRKTGHHCSLNHCSLDVIQDVVSAPADTSVEFRELKSSLFSALRKRAPSRLLPTIEAWEQLPDGCIPCVTGRKHVIAVRKLAQKIARQLGYAPPAICPGTSSSPEELAST